MPVASLFAAAWTDFGRTWPKLLVTDILYQLVAFILLTPLIGVGFRTSLSLAGRSVLADEDILFFVLSPIGLVTLVVVAAAGLAVVAAEQSALLTIGFGAVRDTRVEVREALSVAARHLGSILAIAARLVGRVLLVAAPFLGACGLAYWSLLTELDINYYLTHKPPPFWLAAALIGATLLALAWLLVPRLLGWVYVLPLHLFEDVSPGRALAESARRAQGNRSTIATVLAGWALVSVLLNAVALGVATFLGRVLVPRAQGSISVLLLVMGGLLLFWYVVHALVTLLQASSLALLVARLYEGYGSTKAARLPTEAKGSLTGDARSGLALTGVLGGLLAATVAAGAVGYFLLKSVRTDDDVLVIAHRGAAGRAPENTLASFEAAIDDGADLLELDVQETRDGVVVVIHDSDFMKIAGERVKVWDGNLEELRAFDIGSWFSPAFSSERLPTLEEVLALAKRRGARLDIELKYYGHNERLEERVVELVESAGMASDVVIMSLKADMVAKVRRLRPEWTVGLLTAKAVGELTRADADFLAVHVGMVDPAFVRRAHHSGKDVYVWTVNDPVNMSTMMSRGVDGVITDEPALARSVIADRAGLGSIERLLLEASIWLGADTREPPPEADIR